MISRRATIFLASLFIIAPARADDLTPEAILKEKSLKRAGSAYVLPIEAEFQRKLNAARTLYRSVSDAATRKSEYERNVEAGRNELRQLEQQRVFVNQELAQARNGQENNRLVATVNALNGQINLLNQQIHDPNSMQVLGAKLSSRREDFIEAVFALRQLIDKAEEEYAAAAEDPGITEALASINKKTKAKLVLGPSRTFLDNLKTLEKVEASVLSESVALRKEGGVYMVDVTFNGKVTKPLVFDTGASSVVLPAEMAAEIGLKPSPNDKPIKAIVADGTEVNARMTTIPTMRVGKFTVKDVDCIVMPAEKKNVPPLLGQTFHKHFTYKFTPETGKLMLSRVETEEPAATGPKTKAAAKSRTKKGAKPLEKSSSDK